MTYATLLVHLQCGPSNTALLAVAGQFVERFNLHVIGVAACQRMMMVGSDGMMSGDVYVEDDRQMKAAIERAGVEFHDALQGRSASLEWRSQVTLSPPAGYVGLQGRSADLIMTGSVPADTFNLSRAANSGSLVMEAGRPVFVVPSDAQAMRFDHALIAWKDSRESRRAAADALPLLKEVGRVTILEVAAFDEIDAAHERVQDVGTWLRRHGVGAEVLVERSIGNDIDQIHFAADQSNSDVIVAGAYGHSRLREWMIGGVTRDLLLECRRPVLVSH